MGGGEEGEGEGLYRMFTDVDESGSLGVADSCVINSLCDFKMINLRLRAVWREGDSHSSGDFVGVGDCLGVGGETDALTVLLIDNPPANIITANH